MDLDSVSPVNGRALVDPRTCPALSRITPPGVVDGTVRLSKQEVVEAADRLATALTTRHGIEPGDPVAFKLPNWWETIVAYFACWRLGAIAVPVHHRAEHKLLYEVLERAQPKLLLTDSPASMLNAIAVRGAEDAFADLVSCSPDPSQPHPEPDDTALLMATSGSTGSPKLVRHRHRSLSFKSEVMARVHDLHEDDVALIPAPLAHVSGILNSLVVGRHGGSVVLMDRWSPAQALRFIEAEQVTFMAGPPTFFIDIATDPGFDPARVDSVRIISAGGTAVTPRFVDEMSERFGAFVKRTYGSTEAPTMSTTHATDDPTRARDTDGRPTDHVEMQTVDPDTGQVLPAGVEGELWVRGYELFDGYDEIVATRAVLDGEGWFHTGDLAVIDDDGYLRVVGRLKRTIIRGGENVSPSEVEAVCGGILGVRGVVAVGLPDERLGERIGVVVEADRSIAMEDVRQVCERAGLARFAWPERVLQIERIPRLGSGKADVRALATLFSGEGN